jgi:hypothetical protein
MAYGDEDEMHLAQDRDRTRCFCDKGNETSSSIKDDEILDQVSDYQLLKENSAI